MGISRVAAHRQGGLRPFSIPLDTPCLTPLGYFLIFYIVTPGYGEKRSSRYSALYNALPTLQSKICYVGEKTNSEFALVHRVMEDIGNYKSKAMFSSDETELELLYRKNVLGKGNNL
jgi:hypothetical protein